MENIPVAVPKASPDPLPELRDFLRPFVGVFRRDETRRSIERYVTGLLTDLERKNCDTIAAAVAGTSSERLQYALTDAGWEPQDLDERRVRILSKSSPSRGLLILDDTGQAKKGTKSAGVARQYSGTLGKVGNCQVIVTGEYAADEAGESRPLHWPVTARLYLPEAWTQDRARCQEAHIPDAVSFQTKPEMALHIVDQARAWGVPFKVVVADAGYGDNPDFLAGLEERQLAYVCGIEKTFGLRLPAEVSAAEAAPAPPYQGRGPPRKRRPAPLHTAQALTEALPEGAWRTISWREGTKGLWSKQFVALRAHCATGNPTAQRPSLSRVSTGPEGWLLGERPIPGQPGDRQWYYSNLPADTPLERLVTLAHARWIIEQFYEDAKGECGLDQYQGR
ncbi:MAG: IS701 family transposase, partial [Chloroflexi bacterium]|nr:IS701 family transposase [Chloroflexota bacterium]